MGRRESVIEELAVTRHHARPSVEKRARHNDEPRALHLASARGPHAAFLLDLRDLKRGYSVFPLDFWDLERGWRRTLLDRKTLIKGGSQLVRVLCESDANWGDKHQCKLSSPEC